MGFLAGRVDRGFVVFHFVYAEASNPVTADSRPWHFLSWHDLSRLGHGFRVEGGQLVFGTGISARPQTKKQPETTVAD
jgi:hypothetical protein